MLSLLLAVAAQPQVAEPLPAGAVAVWRGGQADEEGFADWLGRALAPGDEERARAVEHVLQLRLVETEGARRGLSVGADEVEARLGEARAAVEAAGFDLAGELRARGMSEAEFRKLLADSLMHERLARADLSLPADAPVSAAQLQEWTRARLAAILEAHDPAGGLAVDSGPYRIAHAEVGRVLIRTLPARRLRDFAAQHALERALPAWGAELGLTLTDDVLLAELEWRRRRVAENPNYQGASYEGLLAARGSSVTAVLGGSEIRVAGWLRLYARERWPDSWFEALGAEERAPLEREYGAARELSWLMLHAKEIEVDPVLDLTPLEAAQELQRWKGEMRDAGDFARLAELYSEHGASRRRGGRYGTVHPVEPGADPLLCAAAFAIPVGVVSEPLPVAGGMALLLVHSERPAPTEAEFRELVRRGRQEEARADYLAGLGLRTAWDAPPPDADAR
jgi:hypothetical protein